MTAPSYATVVTNSGEGECTLTAADIATAVGGELIGSPNVAVSAVAPIDRAQSTDLTFLAAAKYAPFLATCTPGVLLVTPELAAASGAALARVVVSSPHDALISLLPRLYPAPAPRPGVHATVRLGNGVHLGSAVCLGPYVVLGDGVVVGDRARIDAHVVVGDGVAIGADCHVFPHVTIYAGSSLGARVVVHAGARVGSDGFGYTFSDGAHRQIPHVGRCILHDDVDIGANTTIDRGSIDDTVIGTGSKIDNLVQIAHNVHVGRLCLIMAQVGIAGSTSVGDGCIIAGQVGVQGHVDIGDRARIAAQAGVFGNVPPGETWSGYPARPHREALRASASLFRLAGMIKRLERLLAERE